MHLYNKKNQTKMIEGINQGAAISNSTGPLLLSIICHHQPLPLATVIPSFLVERSLLSKVSCREF